MLISLLGAALLAQGPGTPFTATVNDPLSHGTVGDSLLSLDEAIQFANGTLATTALSAAEQARITAATGDSSIMIDAMTTPTITVQAPLTAAMGQGMMARLMIGGMGPTRPVLQATSQTYVLALRSHMVTIAGLRIVGGQVGIDAQMMAMTMPMPDMGMVMDCELSGQTTAGVHLHGMGTDMSMLMVMDTRLTNQPVGFRLDDMTNGGQLMLEAERVAMDGVNLGADVQEDASGGLSMCMFFRSTFTNGSTLARSRRGMGGTQQFMFRFVFTDAVCTGDVTDIEGSATGLTMVHHHHGDFTAGAGHKAFWVYPRTAEFDVHGSEMVFDGDVSIACNLATMRVWQQNNLYKNGTITYDVDGALPNLLWNRYQNCTIDAPVTARSPIAVRQSELTNTDVHSASPLAPIMLQGCWRSGGAVTGNASEASPAPALFLGTTTITPKDPQVGTSVQLTADLPYGIGMVWDIALSYARPTTTAEPVRFYGDPSTVIILPAFVIFQSTLSVPLPNDPALVDYEFYVQGIALPLLGQSFVPAYHLPRGSLLQLRL